MLTLKGAPTSNLHAATKAYVDGLVTGVTNGTSGGIPYYSSATTMASSAALSQYQVVLGGGAGAAPTIVSGTGTSGQILTSNGAGAAPTWQAASGGGSGDFMKNGTVAMTGALQMGGNTLDGNSTASGNLTLDSTSDSTKGFVSIAPSGGNVGIGTTAPGSPLQIQDGNNPSANSPILTLSKNLGAPFYGGSIDFNFYYTPASNWYNPARIMALDYVNYGGQLAFYTKPNDNVPANASLERMRIDQNGNVGIGTTAPAGLLDVEAGVATNDGSGIILKAQSASNIAQNGGAVSITAGNSGIAGTAGSITLTAGTPGGGGTNGSINLMSGNVGIGTTSPSAKLDVSGQIHAGYNAGTSVAIDWNNANNQYTSPAGSACTAITMTNMLDGGTYTLAVQNVTSGTCTFTSAGLTFVFSPANMGVMGDAVYTFVRMGTKVYVSWITGFQ